MNKLKQMLIGVLLVVMVTSLLSGCGSETKEKSEKPTTEQSSSEKATNETKETIKFTDSVGREVEIPKKIDRVAPSGALAQLVLYTVNPDKIIGWSKNPGEITAKYMDEKYHSLPEFGQFYGKNASLNVEALIKAKPDIIIDIGEKKKTVKEDMDQIQQKTNIPTIFIEATLDNMDKAYETLGEVISEQDRAKLLGEYCKKTVDEAKEKSASIDDNKRVKVYYGVGEDALQTNAKGSIHADVIEVVGAINVAEVEKIGSGGGSQVSPEQIILWNPDAIILSPGESYDKIGSHDSWKDVKAIKDNKYYDIPLGPYNWMGGPPSVNRVIGIKWLGNLLYPDVYDYDMVKEAKEFYKLFYHYDLSDEQAKELMAKSTFK